MIHAANELFGMADDPFLVGGKIAFRPARWEGGGEGDVPAEGPPALFFHELDLPEANADAYRAGIARSIGNGIAGLLGTPWGELAAERADAEPVAPSDIAILVRTAREAGPIGERLAQLSIPVAVGTRSSLLQSPEAKEGLAILAALLDPQDSGALRMALLTPALGSGARLGDGAAFDRLTNDFAELHEIWEARGLLPAVLGLADRFGVRGALLGLDRGLRRLTNLMHLFELLDHKARDEKLPPAAAVQWLEMAIAGSVVDIDAETLELRIATDAPAVQILTQHSSKGLEFPIVFVAPPCPRDYGRGKVPLSYHDAGTLRSHVAPGRG